MAPAARAAKAPPWEWDAKSFQILPRRGKANFDWQDGYGIFSIGQSQMQAVIDYTRGQQKHHRLLTFQDEFRELLRRYELEYDERYVWN